MQGGQGEGQLAREMEKGESDVHAVFVTSGSGTFQPFQPVISCAAFPDPRDPYKAL